jgi:hypothetical protein
MTDKRLWLAVLAASLLWGGCKKDEAPARAALEGSIGASAPAPSPPAAPAPSPPPAPIPSAPPGQPPSPGASALPAVPLSPSKPSAGPEDTGTSEALAKFIASPAHRKAAELARAMLAQAEAGQCDEAAGQAKKLAEAIKAATGELSLGKTVQDMAKQIQADPNYLDKAYMRYKGRLYGLSIGMGFAEMTVKLGNISPEAKKKACDSFIRQLREIKQSP